MAKPEIRLKGFEGEWMRASFSESFHFLKNNSLSRAELNYGNGIVKNIHYGDVLIKFGEILNVSDSILPFITNNDVASKQDRDTLLENGDIVFADAAEDNTVGKCTEIEGLNSSDKIVSGLHTIPSRPNYAFEKGYLGYYLNSNAFHDQLLPMIQGTKVSGISKANLNCTYISYPPNTFEQTALADYFKSLDSMIQGVTKKIASLKQMKQACLVSMFPQAGKTTPRVRFKGFKGEWEKHALADIAKFSKGSGYSKNDLCDSGTPIILYGRLYTRYNTQIDNVDTFAIQKPNSVLSEGNEIIVPASGETPEDIACAAVVNQQGVILGGDLNVIRLDKDFDSYFTSLVITYGDVHYELAKYAQGKSVVHLHNSDICKASISYPSLKEQQQIASFFRSLDSQISLQEARLEKLKQIKSACLDKMFV